MRLPFDDLSRDKLKIIINKNSKYFKTAMMAVIILIAVLFFGSNGENDSHMVIEKTTEIVNAETEKEENTEPTDDSNNQREDIEEVDITIYCDISGEVNNPGVYALMQGDRLDTLIKMAGGLSEDADIDLINRARILKDGEKVYIPKIDEENFNRETGLPKDYPTGEVNEPISTPDGKPEKGLININTASQEELESIPGIGPVTAEKIISYRESNGLFTGIEELVNVSGIGTKTIKKIEQYITV